MEKTPIARAVDALKGQKPLADALGVHQSLVSQWVTGRRPVAPEHCPRIEALTGVRCNELLPETKWERDHEGQVTGYHVPLSGSQAA